jgi:uncharacterized alkaline shock family protein YloU
VGRHEQHQKEIDMSTVTPATSTSTAVATSTGDAAGVHDLGNGAARAIGAIRNAINQQDRSQGVSVEVGEKQVAADIVIVAEYPVELQKVADDVRTSVTDAISQVVGMEVTEVNVTVSDVFIPSDDADDADDSRVQ